MPQCMRIVRKITIVKLGGKWLGNWFADQMRWDGVGENGDFMMLEIGDLRPTISDLFVYVRKLMELRKTLK